VAHPFRKKEGLARNEKIHSFFANGVTESITGDLDGERCGATEDA